MVLLFMLDIVSFHHLHISSFLIFLLQVVWVAHTVLEDAVLLLLMVKMLLLVLITVEELVLSMFPHLSGNCVIVVTSFLLIYGVIVAELRIGGYYTGQVLMVHRGRACSIAYISCITVSRARLSIDQIVKVVVGSLHSVGWKSSIFLMIENVLALSIWIKMMVKQDYMKTQVFLEAK